MVSALASSSLLERKVSPKALKALVKDWDLLQDSGKAEGKFRSSLKLHLCLGSRVVSMNMRVRCWGAQSQSWRCTFLQSLQLCTRPIIGLFSMEKHKQVWWSRADPWRKVGLVFQLTQCPSYILCYIRISRSQNIPCWKNCMVTIF